MIWPNQYSVNTKNLPKTTNFIVSYLSKQLYSEQNILNFSGDDTLSIKYLVQTPLQLGLPATNTAFAHAERLWHCQDCQRCRWRVLRKWPVHCSPVHQGHHLLHYHVWQVSCHESTQGRRAMCRRARAWRFLWRVGSCQLVNHASGVNPGRIPGHGAFHWSCRCRAADWRPEANCQWATWASLEGNGFITPRKFDFLYLHTFQTP